MGLFDDVLGKLGLGSAAGALEGGMLGHITDLLNDHQPGGLTGLVAAFQAKGLGPIIQSWVGTGPNQPITADQIVHAIGPERVQMIAKKLGVAPETVSAKLAEYLPTVIDKLTPHGTVPAGPVALPTS